MTSTLHHCEQCQLQFSDSESLAGGCPRCFARKLNLAENADAEPHKASGLSTEVEQLQQSFSEYELLDVIGHGGMSVVVRARDKQTDGLVAIKILKPPSTDADQWEARFDRETDILSRLSHPAITAILRAGTAGEHRYMAMEYVAGVNLRDYIGESRLSPQEMLTLVPDICDGLQYIHDEGVVHRDIKPENILVGENGRAKITDFGLSKLAVDDSQSPAMTKSNQIFGTPRYMAPEQFESTATLDHRADLYALGAVMYEMLTGVVPQAGSDPPSKVEQQRIPSPIDWSAGPDISQGMAAKLDALVARLMSRHPRHAPGLSR